MSKKRIQKKKGKGSEKGELWKRSGGEIEKEQGREKENEKWNVLRGREVKGQEAEQEADLDHEKESEKGKEKGQDLEKERGTGGCGRENETLKMKRRLMKDVN